MPSNFVSFVDLSINNAEQFKESISETSANNNLYLTYGKVDAWANEANPDIASTCIGHMYDAWNNMIGAKKLVGSDLSFAIKRNNWTANTKYTAYDDQNSKLFDSNTSFYVVTSDFSVYKCLSNNSNSKSNVEPTSVNPSIATTTSDGYIWKYMYTVSDAGLVKFTTSSYIPVKSLTLDDGSIQWQVQENAVDGAVEAIVITNGGSGYSNTSNIVITINGDGSSATAVATVNTMSNSVNSITITERGFGYSYADVVITSASGSNATARAIMSPPGGHGSDPLYELGGRSVMINGRFKYDEEGVLPITNDFRQVCLLKDPLLSTSNVVASNSAILQATTMTVVGSDDYFEDEWVYQGPNLTMASFKGRVVEWDKPHSKLVLINTSGIPTASQSLIGVTSSAVCAVSSVAQGALKKYSGKMLYLSNMPAIERSSDQIEDFKILVHF